MQKIINWILAKLPWALQNHYHGDPTLLKYGACSRCGHLILMGHVKNGRVSIRAWGITWGASYSKACTPTFTHLELAPDKTVRAYQEVGGGRIEMLPSGMGPKDREEFERLSLEMIEEVAHLKSGS